MTVVEEFIAPSDLHAPAAPPVLSVRDLVVEASRDGRRFLPVSDVSFEVAAGETVGLVGESGSGKSLTLRAVLGLLPSGVRQVGGAMSFDLGGGGASTDPSALRGRGLAMVFQEPMTALNPTMRVGKFVTEGARLHRSLSRREAETLAVELLAEVGVPEPSRRARSWPHGLSGGLRQRVMIAAALATDPKLLLCDEPTTALDATIQDQILNLLDGIKRDRNMSMVFVTHDLGIVGQICDRVAVMYAGQLVEAGPVEEVFRAPTHAYTLGLLGSLPDLPRPGERLVAISGHPPEATEMSAGCPFAPRCSFVLDECRMHPYALVPVRGEQRSACLRADEIPESGL